MDERLSIVGRSLSPRWRALYAAAVAGLATFVLLALLFPEPIRLYRARAVVEQTAELSGSEPVEAPLATQVRIEDLGREAVQRSAAHGETAVDEAFACQVERLSPHQARITIDTQDRYANRSLELCREVATEVVERSEKSFVPNLVNLRSQRSNLEQRLALVRDAKREAENELAALEREHVTQLSAALVRQAKSEAQPESASDELLRIQREWQLLSAERRDLARTKTDEHPQIKDLDERLATLQQQLNALTPQPAASDKNPVASLQEDFRVRSRELGEAVTEARRRENELLSEAARLAVTPEPVALRTKIVQSPQVIQRDGGQPSLPRLVVLAALSAGVAGMVYWLLRQLAIGRSLRSVDEVQKELGLPVLSVIGPAQASPTPHKWEPIVRRSVVAAELLLLVLALSAALLVLAQPHLTRPAAADPFGAVAESLDRTLSPTLRR